MLPIEPGTLGEIVLRVVVVYVALLVALRLAGRRSLSDITAMDMLVLLLVSETVSPALTAGDDSVAGGLVAAVTLILLSVLASYLAYRLPGFERLAAGTSVCLVRDGKVDAKARRRYRITDDDLEIALHEQGVLKLEDVQRAFVEPDGTITVIEKKRR